MHIIRFVDTFLEELQYMRAFSSKIVANCALSARKFFAAQYLVRDCEITIYMLAVWVRIEEELVVVPPALPVS